MRIPIPEITISGLRDVGQGPSEAQHEMRQALIKNGQVKLWGHAGTEEECEEAWRQFLLEDALGSVIL